MLNQFGPRCEMEPAPLDRYEFSSNTQIVLTVVVIALMAMGQDRKAEKFRIMDESRRLMGKDINRVSTPLQALFTFVW